MRQLVVVVGHLMHFFVQKIHQEKWGRLLFILTGKPSSLNHRGVVSLGWQLFRAFLMTL
jgi:hypothetical protein